MIEYLEPTHPKVELGAGVAKAMIVDTALAPAAIGIFTDPATPAPLKIAAVLYYASTPLIMAHAGFRMWRQKSSK